MNTPAKQFLLINPAPWSPKNAPFGISILAAYLNQHEIATRIFDLNIFLYKRHPEIHYAWNGHNHAKWFPRAGLENLMARLRPDLEEAVAEIRQQDYPVIGFSVTDTKQFFTLEFIKLLKQQGYNGKIIIGGAIGITPEARQDLWHIGYGQLIDALVVGEGEISTLELLRAFAQGEYQASIAGVLYPTQQGWTALKPRTLIPELDSLPYVDYSGFQLADYTQPTLPTEWSRGCVRDCVFCENKTQWKYYRQKSPDRIVAELASLIQQTGIRKFNPVDPSIGADLRQLERLCDLLIERQLNIEWGGSFLPLKHFTAQTAHKLYAAGCRYTACGVESGSDRIRRLMRKAGSTEDFIAHLRNLHQARIKTGIYIVVGFPGETESDFQATLDFIKQHREFISSIKSVTPLFLQYGSYLSRHLAEFGIKVDPHDPHWKFNWQGADGNCLAVRLQRVKRVFELAQQLDLPLIE